MSRSRPASAGQPPAVGEPASAGGRAGRTAPGRAPAEADRRREARYSCHFEAAALISGRVRRVEVVEAARWSMRITGPVWDGAPGEQIVVRARLELPRAKRIHAIELRAVGEIVWLDERGIAAALHEVEPAGDWLALLHFFQRGG